MGKFIYKKRSKEVSKKREDQRGYVDRDSMVKIENINFFKPKNTEGGKKNKIRYLPPTWGDGSEHYGFDVFVHYEVGQDKSTYLCPNKMLGKYCPICEERTRAVAENADKDTLWKLKPTKRVAVWIIDRNDESAGPKLWLMPWTFDRDLVVQSEDDDTGEYYSIDDPDEGYDVTFEKKGEKKDTTYIGIKLSKNSSPLSEDDDKVEEWLSFIVENKLPDIFKYYSGEYIEKVFNGEPTYNKEGGVEDDEGAFSKYKEVESEEEENTDVESDGESEEETEEGEVEYTYKGLSNMDMDDLGELAVELEVLTKKEVKKMDKEEIVSEICEALGIEKEEIKEPVAPPKKSLSEKLREKKNK
jgi:hypothetical protein